MFLEDYIVCLYGFVPYLRTALTCYLLCVIILYLLINSIILQELERLRKENEALSKENERKDQELRRLNSALSDAQVAIKEWQIQTDSLASQLKKVETKLRRTKEDAQSTIDGESHSTFNNKNKKNIFHAFNIKRRWTITILINIEIK